MKLTPIVAVLLLFQVGLVANAEDSADWPRWRGPLDNGSIEAGRYPVRFSGETFQWKSALPGKGCSTPIVWKKTIYVTATAEGKDSLLAFDWSGKLKWQATFGQQDAGRHRNGSGANASPVTDGE